MTESSRVVQFVNAAVEEALARGLTQLDAEDERLDGRLLRIRGRPTLNFASCSYLGLELHPRLRQGVIDAVERYGAQFSSSRAFLSAPLYAQLEASLDRIFSARTVVTPSTTLAHLSALPILIEAGDAVLLDHQVHQTVHLCMPQVRLQGSLVEIVRHGRIDRLEERIRELSASHERIWYLSDGVYSMYGDLAPMKAICWLLERYDQLHVYIDDAHGMSWTGRHGRGLAAEWLQCHPRSVIAVSLNKAFGAAGGALVFHDPAMRRKVRNVGSTLMFTGPIQPPMLGAAVESARIHLSPEIERLQEALAERIRFANHTARQLDLPLASDCEVPIRYVGLGVRAAVFDMTAHLLERGIYVNPCGFPAVGSRNAGVRLTLTAHHSKADIRHALEVVAERLPVALAQAGTSREEVDRAFGLPSRTLRPLARGIGTDLRCQRAHSIHALDAAEWDRCLAGRGSFDAATLAALEAVFREEQAPENHWRFHYHVVRDAQGYPVLATFFTQALWKDDLLAAAQVSRAVEQRRQRDPFFLTSRVLAMGSLLTEGDHLHIDRSRDWRGALAHLLAAVNEDRDECQAAAVVLRDLPAEDAELAAALADAGFFRVELPASLVVEIDWRGREQFLARRSKRERRFHREQVLAFEDAWQVDVVRRGQPRLREAEWAHLHALYRGVQRRQLALNTFPLPAALLPHLVETAGWELLLLRHRGGPHGEPTARPQGFIACHAGPEEYAPVLVGMDYAFVESHGLYRQLLAQSLWRAEALGARRVAFGMGSELEKRRLGARPVQRVMYVQSHDRYHQDVLDLIASDAHLAAQR